VKELKEMQCPQCRNVFRLVWNDYTTIDSKAAPRTLMIRDCPSGGVYDVAIVCPHCHSEEEL
jgi:hypothetical protein